MKKWMLQIISVFSFIFGATLFYFVISSYDISSIIESVKSFGLPAFLGFLAFSLINFLFYTWRWWVIIKNTGTEKSRVIKFTRLFLHRMTGYAFNYLTPAGQSGGEFVRAGILMNDGIKKERAVASVSVDLALELLFLGFFLMAGVLTAVLEGVVEVSLLELILVFTAVLAVLALTLYLALKKKIRPIAALEKKCHKDNWLHSIIKTLAETEKIIVEFFHKGPKVLFSITALSVAVIIMRMAEVAFIISAFGLSATFTQAFLIATLPGLALMLPVPGGVGVFEGSFVAIFTALSIPLSGIAFVAIVRGRDLVFILLGLIHGLIFTRGRIKSISK